MAGGTGLWGSGSWGASSWGGGSGSFALVAVTAHRENVFRVEFSSPVYFSTYLDPPDASLESHWAIAPVAGTVGMNGQAARPLGVAAVRLPLEQDGVPIADVGRFVDVVSDRPMTPDPAIYELSVIDVYSLDLSEVVSGSAFVPAVYRLIQPPTLDALSPSRDVAYVAPSAASTGTVSDALVLGTYGVDSTGDVALDEGDADLRKRAVRRLITRKSSFAHLPGYGVGLTSFGKQLGRAATVAQIVADAESQLLEEPDVAKAKCSLKKDPQKPNLWRFRAQIQPRGRPRVVTIEVPVVAG
jgi:hypothetical protein